MKNTDIKDVRYNGNEVTALYKGSTLIYQKVTDGGILSGTFSSADSNTFWYNATEDITIPLDDDLNFSMNVSGLTNCYMMFKNNHNIVSITEFPPTSNVTNMNRMFDGCWYLANLNLGDNFDTSNVTDMERMFAVTMRLNTIDLGENFDTSNVTNMRYMFVDSLVDNLYLGDKFDMANVTDSLKMFDQCLDLTNVTGTISNIKQNLDLHWSPLTNDSAMVFVNGLANMSETRTIKFKSTAYNTLTEEQIALATSKGWTVVSA